MGEDDDDSVLDGSKDDTCNSKSKLSVLSHHHTKKIADLLKMLVRRCADEEQMMGNNVHYWNILTGEDVKTIASNAPTTIDDLRALGILGEKKLEEYGARIVKPIKTFVDKEGFEFKLS